MSIKQEKTTNWYKTNQERLFTCKYQDDKIIPSNIWPDKKSIIKGNIDVLSKVYEKMWL